MEEPQISQILSRLRACYRTLNCQFFLPQSAQRGTKDTKGNWLIG